MKCEAIFVNSALYSVRKMCEALRVKQCQYYQWIRQRANREKKRIDIPEEVCYNGRSKDGFVSLHRTFL